jgi:hypothetical protein
LIGAFDAAVGRATPGGGRRLLGPARRVGREGTGRGFLSPFPETGVPGCCLLGAPALLQQLLFALLLEREQGLRTAVSTFQLPCSGDRRAHAARSATERLANHAISRKTAASVSGWQIRTSEHFWSGQDDGALLAGLVCDYTRQRLGWFRSGRALSCVSFDGVGHSAHALGSSRTIGTGKALQVARPRVATGAYKSCLTIRARTV